MVDVPLATPGAQVDIEPESLLVTDLRKSLERLMGDGGEAPANLRGAETLPEEDRLPALLDLLTALGPVEETDLTELNNELARYGAEVRLRR